MKIEIDLGEIIGQAKNIEQDETHRFVTDDEKQKWNDAYDHSKVNHISLGMIYEGDMSAANRYVLDTSMLGFSYVEIMGKDSDGEVWSEKIIPINFIGGVAFSVHGIKFSGINSGPNITVTQNTSGASIYKIIGVKA